MSFLFPRISRIGLAPLFFSVLAANLAFSSLQSAHAAPVQARKADDFVDSIGVDLHVYDYDDAASWSAIKAHLGGLGVRYYRDGLEHVDNPTRKAHFRDLYDTYGMKMLAVCGPYGNDSLQPDATGSLSHVADKIAAIKPFTLAVEGPNEPEFFWFDGWKFGGFSDRPGQVVWYQNKLYDTIKGDARTRDVPVTTFATARPETYSNYFSNKPLVKHDIFAWHYYNGRYLPTPYDWIARGRDYLGSDAATKPAYLTEHGYRIRGDGSVTPKAQMKLNTRSLAFFFNWDNYNNQKVFFYVAGKDSAAGEDYGLANADLSPRPVYNSMKSVLSYLKEATWNSATKTWKKPVFTPGSLDYTVSGDAGDYGWRLTQKSGGDFYLMALPYNQIANPGDGTDYPSPTHNVTLTFAASQKVAQYKVDETSGNYVETPLTPGATSVNIALSDALVIFKISPASVPPTAPKAR